MKKPGFLFFVVFCIAVCLLGAINYGQTATAPALDTSRVLIEYSQFLRAETERHQKILESIYDKLFKVLTTILIVFGVVFTWLQWRTRKEVEDQVNNRIDALAKGAIDEKLKAFDEQLHTIRDDLARQVKDLKSSLDDQVRDINLVMFSPMRPVQLSAEKHVAPSPASKSILWVDDYPHNNDGPAGILRDNGAEIITALSTEQAMTVLATRSFDLIISDMGRGKNYTAGLDFLQELSAKSIKIPTIIFTSPRVVMRFTDDARKLGATAIISGTTSLLDTAFSILGLRDQKCVS